MQFRFIYLFMFMQYLQWSLKQLFRNILIMFSYIGFKCGSINFHKQNQQPAKYKYLFIAPLIMRVEHTEAVILRCSVKKVFLEISQNLQEKTCARVSFLGLRPATLLKQRLWHRCFSCEYYEISKNTFFKEHLQWLLLNITLSNTE